MPPESDPFKTNFCLEPSSAVLCQELSQKGHCCCQMQPYTGCCILPHPLVFIKACFAGSHPENKPWKPQLLLGTSRKLHTTEQCSRPARSVDWGTHTRTSSGGLAWNLQMGLSFHTSAMPHSCASLTRVTFAWHGHGMQQPLYTLQISSCNDDLSAYHISKTSLGCRLVLASCCFHHVHSHGCGFRVRFHHTASTAGQVLIRQLWKC